MRILKLLIVLPLAVAPVLTWAQEEGKKIELPTNKEELKDAAEDVALESAKTFRDWATELARGIQEECLWLVRDVQNDIREMRRDWDKHIEKHW